jgi:hypothetical protein
LLRLIQRHAINLIPDLYTLKMKKVILITGASSGIGKSIAQHLAGLGYMVYGTSGNIFIHEDESIRTLKMDVCVPESIQTGVSQIIKECGCIDIVINHAGLDMAGLSERMSQDDSEQVPPDNPQGAPNQNVSLLTPREKEIAALICEGLTSKAISGKLFISEATVKPIPAIFIKNSVLLIKWN